MIIVATRVVVTIRLVYNSPGSSDSSESNSTQRVSGMDRYFRQSTGIVRPSQHRIQCSSTENSILKGTSIAYQTRETSGGPRKNFRAVECSTKNPCVGARCKHINIQNTGIETVHTRVGAQGAPLLVRYCYLEDFLQDDFC